MAYPAVQCFRGSSVPLEQTNQPKALQCDQKAALITDFVVATLFVTVGILALIQIIGLADLGALSGLGSIGPTAAYAMILTGVAIVAVDLVTLMIKQARFISKLQSLSTARNGEGAEVSQQLEDADVVSHRYEERIQRLEESIEGEDERIRNAVQLSTEDLNLQIRQMRLEGERSKETAEKLSREKNKLIEELRRIDENAQKAGEEYKRKVEELSEQLRVAKQASEETGREQQERVKELTLNLQRAEEKARQTGEEHKRKVEELSEQLRVAKLASEETGREQQERVKELTLNLQRAEEKAQKVEEEHKRKVEELSEQLRVAKQASEEIEREQQERVKELTLNLQHAEEKAQKVEEEHKRKVEELSEQLRVAKQASEEIEREQQERVKELTLNLQRAEEKAQKVEEEHKRKVEELSEQLRVAKQASEEIGREQQERVKELTLNLQHAEEKARQAGEEREREVNDLKEKLRVAKASAEETGREQEERIKELEVTLQRAKENAQKVEEEHEREIKGLKEKLESAELSDQKLGIERRREIEELNIEIQRLKEAIRKKKEEAAAKETDVVLPSTVEFEEKKKPVGGLLTASLLMRGKLDLGSDLKAPQMKSSARDYVLHLAKTPQGLSKVRGALQGFQNYLEEKVTGLKAKPSSDENVGAFGKILAQDLESSLFGSAIFEEEISMEHSFMVPVIEMIDIEDLDPNLEEYFTTLANWIKKGRDPKEQIKRTEVAMEKFTTELIDAVNEIREKKLESTKLRLEGAHEQRLQEIEKRKEELAFSQRTRIEQALTLSPTKEDHYNLRSLSFEKVDKTGKMQIKSALIDTFKEDTIDRLMELKKFVVEEADRLFKLDLSEDCETEIKGLEQASNNLIGYIQTIDRSCKKVKYHTILERA